MGKRSNKNFAFGITLITSGMASKIVSNPFCFDILPVAITNGPDSEKDFTFPLVTKEFPLEISLIVCIIFSEVINGL